METEIFPSYSVGWVDDTDTLEIVGTFNNNLQRLPPDEFDMLVRRFANSLAQLKRTDELSGGERSAVIVLARQDAPDTVTLDSDF